MIEMGEKKSPIDFARIRLKWDTNLKTQCEAAEPSPVHS